MLLTPRREAALFAVLVSGQPSMSDLFEIQNLQADLVRRSQIRQHLDDQSRRAEEMNR
jgi:hypothetical protein